ncbi:hypothetical protein [Cupriavidus sp. UYPR2.512]|uniref:hypothetical protein n=1 Tax=Cupriavidus sp. UYPR2.512 TaxID=1080187 RepID=UPI0003A601A4|nr:hypothetical protein [Cupriavidus sp. UYPR2.512]UIF90879.1 hypothetical protein KAF44_32340 [Cupriavidus necator]
MAQLLATVKQVHARRAESIKGTGYAANRLRHLDETFVDEGSHFFSMGGPLDAPEHVPAGGIAAHLMRNEWRDTWNVPVQILTARA